MDELGGRILGEVRRDGPMAFSTYLELALYAPGLGFYERAGQAGGRRGDFVTSVETGPLFAAVIGDWLDNAWRDAGEPQRFVVAEAAAGVGTLWRGIVKAAPACFDALEWVLVERSAALRQAHTDLPGERVRTLADLPHEPVDVVLANELLDNLVFDIAERTTDGWQPVHVAETDGRLAFVVVDGEVSELADVVPQAPVGTRVPIAIGAGAWVERARAIATTVLLFDYGASTAELGERGGWLRTYAGHERGSDPLLKPGTRDITHDVPFDQLPPATRSETQADWLRRNGTDARVAAARESWNARASVGDLKAMFARSAINEAAALLDPDGLGGFRVIEWA